MTYDTEDFFASNFFKAIEYLPQEGAEMSVIVSSLEREEVGKNKEAKPILHFSNGDPKPLILNRTNWNTLRNEFGPPANWKGHKIILYSKIVEYGGETILGTRIRIPKNLNPVKQASRAPLPVRPSHNPARDPAEEPPPYEEIPDYIMEDVSDS
jgi:hypothetical protein